MSNTMGRLPIFHAYQTHAWYNKMYCKLSNADLEFAIDFIVRNEHLNVNEFESLINKTFMNNSPPSKRWKEIMELLSCANSALRT